MVDPVIRTGVEVLPVGASAAGREPDDQTVWTPRQTGRGWRHCAKPLATSPGSTNAILGAAKINAANHGHRQRLTAARNAPTRISGVKRNRIRLAAPITAQA